VNPRLAIVLALVGVFALGAVVLAASGGDETRSGPKRFEGATLPPALAAPDFSLSDENGKRITMRSLRGRPVIVTFLYTTCEDTCPTQAQQVRSALDELGDGAAAIAVAVDPPRDTPERARAFLSEQRLTGRMRFALGSRAQLAPVWRGFGAQPQREDLEHTARLVLVDPEGRQRVSYPLDQVTPERIAHDVGLLLPPR